MSDRDVPSWSAEGPAGAAEVSERIRSLLADAESAADALRHQAEQESQARLRAAETEALRVVEEARREAERFLTDRIERVSKLSDDILKRGQSIVERLDAADEVRGQLAELVLALGETAARLANEVRAMPGPRAPDIARQPVRRDWAQAESEPAAVEPSVAAESERDAGPSVAAESELASLVAEPEAEEPGPSAPAESRTPWGGSSRDEAPEPPSPASFERDEPLSEPTPLRREPSVEPVADSGEPADADAEEPAAPTAEEAELIEQVRAAERDRVEDGESGPAPGEPGAHEDGNGVATDIVEIRATETVSAGMGPDQALGARLVALQMAVAGGNRGEVESHLRRAFDLSEPGAILDDIFGTGTDSDKCVAWPEVG
jgi:vacuolar-type H+-ATPase subunit H